MKFTNETTWSDDTLKALIRFAAKEVGLPLRQIGGITFRTRRSGAYSGYHLRRRFKGHKDPRSSVDVSIGTASNYPTVPDHRPGMQGEVMIDREEALVSVLAHELAHAQQHHGGRVWRLKDDRQAEFDARWFEVRVLRKFRQLRHEFFPKVSEKLAACEPCPAAAPG